MKVKVKKLYLESKLPTKATDGSAAYDLFAQERLIVWGAYTYKVPTGIAVEIPKGYVGLLFARSSLYKKSLTLANCVGVIDSDYRGEIVVLLTPYGSDRYSKKIIEKGERFAQLLIVQHEDVEWEEVDELSSTEREKGGLGSTGKD